MVMGPLVLCDVRSFREKGREGLAEATLGDDHRGTSRETGKRLSEVGLIVRECVVLSWPCSFPRNATARSCGPDPRRLSSLPVALCIEHRDGAAGPEESPR